MASARMPPRRGQSAAARRRHGRGAKLQRLKRQSARVQKQVVQETRGVKRPREVPLDVPEPAPKLRKIELARSEGAAEWGEQSREEMGLKLLGELAPSNVPWTYPLLDDDWRCFAGYLPQAIKPPQTAAFFKKVHDGTKWLQPTGRWGPLPLKTAWMTTPNLPDCKYRYGGAEVLPEPFPEWMNEIMAVVMPLCGLPDPDSWPNSCNLNLYKDGQHSVGWHADNESLFQGKVKDIRIISLSLGQTRLFELQCKGSPTLKLNLADGDLCTMEGLCQKHYTHRVGKDLAKKKIGPRINLTWRWVIDPAVVDCTVKASDPAPAPAACESKRLPTKPRK